MDCTVTTMMHAVRRYFRFAHIDGPISSDPAVYREPVAVFACLAAAVSGTVGMRSIQRVVATCGALLAFTGG